MILSQYDESKHPRDERGQFATIAVEAVVGTGTGVLPGIHDATYEAKSAYTRDVVAAIDDSGVFAAIGLSDPVVDVGPGYWDGASNPCAYLQVADMSHEQAKAIAAVLGKCLHQDGVGLQKLAPVEKSADANVLVVTCDSEITPEQAMVIGKAAHEAGGYISCQGNEVRIFNIGEKSFDEFEVLATDALAASGATTTEYVKSSNLWAHEPYVGSDSYDEVISSYDRRRNQSNGQTGTSGSSNLQGTMQGLYTRVQAIRARYAKQEGWGDPEREAQLREAGQALGANTNTPDLGGSLSTSEGGSSFCFSGHDNPQGDRWSSVFFLSDMQRSGGQYRIEALRVGHWDYPGKPNGLNITEDLLSELEGNFKAAYLGPKLPVDGPSRGGEAHSDSDLHDCAWVKDVAKDGRSLFAYLDITNPEVKAMVDEGSLCYGSSELRFNWQDPKSKKTMNVLSGFALTNRPYLKGLDPIRPVVLSDRATKQIALDEEFKHLQTVDYAAHSNPIELGESGAPSTDPSIAVSGPNAGGESQTNRSNQMEDKTKTIETPPDTGAINLAEIRANLAEETLKRELLETQLAEQQRQHEIMRVDLKMKDVQGQLSHLVRHGKLTVPIYNRALKLSEILAKSGGDTIALGTKVVLSEGGAQVDQINVIDEMMALLSELPNSMTTKETKLVLLADESDPLSDDDNEDAVMRKAKALLSEGKAADMRTAITMAESAKRGVA